MVVSLGPLLQGDFAAVGQEVAQIVETAASVPVKVIIECCYLSPELMTRATEICVAAGAAYVKTSTGFGPHGARLEDVERLVSAAAGRAKVKAAGGIRNLEETLAFIDAGAARIGTSSGVKIMQEWSAANGR